MKNAAHNGLVSAKMHQQATQDHFLWNSLYQTSHEAKLCKGTNLGNFLIPDKQRYNPFRPY